MAWEKEQPIVDGTRVAKGDLTELRFRFVALDSDGTVVPVGAATDRPYGVLQNAPRDGEEAAVCLIGITKLWAGAALEATDLVQTDGDGNGTSTGANDAFGVTIDGAGAGEVATVAVNVLNF